MNRLSIPSSRRQRGVSLFTVLILLLLSLTAVMGAFRVASLNEAMLGNTADYVRARAAAEAMVRDAEIDIRGRLPSYALTQTDGQFGWPCKPRTSDPATADPLLDEVGYLGCRRTNTFYIPRNSQDYDKVSDLFDANPSAYPYRCSAGICMPASATSLGLIETNLAAMTAYGATYRQYTGGTLATSIKDSNPILTGTGSSARAWYWIEAFPYDSSAGYASGATPSSRFVPNKGSYLFRITAIAQGLKPGTQVVIRSVFVPYPATN